MEKEVVTIREIARRLHISPSTVSRALHDHPRIGLRTKMQVKQLAKELNYEPNQQAIAFKQKKTFTLGLILPGVQEEFFSLVINGIEDAALKNKYSVLIGQSHNDLEQEKQILKAMFDHHVDGLLVSISINTSDIDHFNTLNKYKIPIVFFDRAPNVPDVNTVWCKIYDSTLAAFDFLVSEGHKKIAYLGGPQSLNIKTKRLNAYRESHKKYNIPLQENYIVRTNLSAEGTCAAMKELIDQPEPPTAVIAFNDSVALDAIQYAKEVRGLKINQDICFVSYANWPITNYMESKPIASIEQFPYEQGTKAAALLFELLDATSRNEAITPRDVTIESELIIHKKVKK